MRMADHNDLLKSLRQITQAIDLYSKHLLKETGLTSPQLLVLQALSVPGRRKPSEIARSVNLSQGTITSIVDRRDDASRWPGCGANPGDWRTVAG